MEKKHDDPTETIVELLGDEDEDEDETLSLSDLPLIHKTEEEKEEERNQIHEDFDFCSLSKQPEMRAADDLFFQGQILPLRRSVTRSESMDHLHTGPAGLISSRSSSISSLQSSSSGSSSAGPRQLPPARNRFHSHPSPSPRIHNPNHRNHNCPKKSPSSSVWDVFRLGILTPPPEIAFMDFKPPRTTTNGRNFGSRNSTDSNSSSLMSNVKKKNRSLILGGCKCSADAVDTVINKRSPSENAVMETEKLLVKKQTTKKQLSHRRTFEWLKQLSIEDDQRS